MLIYGPGVLTALDNGQPVAPLATQANQVGPGFASVTIMNESPWGFAFVNASSGSYPITPWSVAIIPVSPGDSWQIQPQDPLFLDGNYVMPPGVANEQTQLVAQFSQNPSVYSIRQLFTMTVAEISGTTQVTVDTTGGPVDVSGTVDIGNTPSVTVSSGTVDIGNTPSVTVDTSGGAVDVQGTVSIGNTPAVTINTASGPVDITGPVTVSGSLTSITDPVSVSGTVAVEGVAGGTTIGIAGTVDIGNTPSVTVDTSGGAVDVQGTVSIGPGASVTVEPGSSPIDISGNVGISGTPNVAITSGTVDIGNSPSVTVTSGTVDAVIQGPLEVSNSNIQLEVSDIVALVSQWTTLVNLAPGANTTIYAANYRNGFAFIDQLVMLIQAPNNDIQNLGVEIVDIYVSDQAGNGASLGMQGASFNFAAPTLYTSGGAIYYQATYEGNLGAGIFAGGQIGIQLTNNGSATIAETLTISCYGHVVTQDVNVSNTPSVTVASGTVDISGTPNVAITSGTVDIGNTPAVTINSGTVDIGNTPSVTVASGTVDIGNTPSVTVDTSGGAVDVSGTVDIGNTPSVTVSSGTVDIGNTPAVTINTSGGAVDVTGSVTISGTPTVSISGTPTVDINSGTVDIGSGNITVVGGQGGGINVSTQTPPQPLGQVVTPSTGGFYASLTVILPAGTTGLRVAVYDEAALKYTLQEVSAVGNVTGNQKFQGNYINMELTHGADFDTTVAGDYETYTVKLGFLNTPPSSYVCGEVFALFGGEVVSVVNAIEDPLFVLGPQAGQISQGGTNLVQVDQIVAGQWAAQMTGGGSTAPAWPDQAVIGLQGSTHLSVQVRTEAPQFVKKLGFNISAGAYAELVPGVAGQSIRLRKVTINASVSGIVEIDLTSSNSTNNSFAAFYAMPSTLANSHDFEGWALPLGASLWLWASGAGTIIGVINYDQY
jgi:hypothetical protein